MPRWWDIGERLIEDWNEIAAENEQTYHTDPYFFLEPHKVREQMKKRSYTSYFGPRKKRRVGGRRKFIRGQKRMIGHRIGSSTAKYNNVANFTLRSFDSFTINEIINCSQLIQGDGINQRERAAINFRGWKILCRFVNTSNEPLIVNWALVSPKDSDTWPALDGFFRSDGLANRGKGASDFLTPLEWQQSSINTDKYNILAHKRCEIGPDFKATLGGTFPTTASEYSGNIFKSWRMYKRYVPLKRQIRFDNPGSESSDADVYFIHWASGFRATGTDPNFTPPETNKYATEVRITQVFRDPKV